MPYSEEFPSKISRTYSFGNSAEYGKVNLATEIKVTVMTFQNTPDGVCPMYVVAERPQPNNESNEFIKDMELAATESVH